MGEHNRTTNRDEQKPQERHEHPPEWERDLNPNHMAGQNVGPSQLEREQPIATAFEVKELHDTLGDLSDDELKQIPILPSGARLQAGATYVDLANPPGARREITTAGGRTAGEGRYFVPKDRVPYQIWNKLIGEVKPPNR